MKIFRIKDQGDFHVWLRQMAGELERRPAAEIYYYLADLFTITEVKAEYQNTYLEAVGPENAEDYRRHKRELMSRDLAKSLLERGMIAVLKGQRKDCETERLTLFSLDVRFEQVGTIDEDLAARGYRVEGA